jgi:hypothetical protein
MDRHRPHRPNACSWSFMQKATISFALSVHADPPAPSGRAMKKKPSRRSRRSAARDTMRAGYDFSRGVRGKYASRLKPGGMLIVLDPDVAEAFGDAKSVNRALRTLLGVVPPRGARTRRRTA